MTTDTNTATWGGLKTLHLITFIWDPGICESGPELFCQRAMLTHGEAKAVREYLEAFALDGTIHDVYCGPEQTTASTSAELWADLHDALDAYEPEDA